MQPAEKLIFDIIEQAIKEARRDGYRYYVSQQVNGWNVSVRLPGNFIVYDTAVSGEEAVRKAKNCINRYVRKARKWLISEDCHNYFEELDMENTHNIVVRWVECGCPKQEDAVRMKEKICG